MRYRPGRHGARPLVGRRSTLERTAGLHAFICAACRGINPVPVGEPAPERCSHCGAAPFVDVADAPKE